LVSRSVSFASVYQIYRNRQAFDSIEFCYNLTGMNGDKQYPPGGYPPQPPPDQYPPQPPAWQQPVPPPVQKDGIGKYIAFAAIGCFGFLVFLGIAVFVIFRLTANPVKIVNDQLAAIRAGDLEKAYSYCSSDFKEQTNYQQFQDFLSSFPSLKNSKEFSSPNRSIENNVTKLTGTIESTSGPSISAEYHLKQETGSWKIQYMYFKSQGEQPKANSEQSPAQPAQPAAPSSAGNLSVYNLRIRKEPQGDDLIKVDIDFDLSGFSCETNTNCNVDVIQDLKTTGPDGSVQPELSKDAIQEWKKTVIGNTGSQSFNNWLKIPLSYPHGTYNVTLVARDQFSGKSAQASTTFEFP